MKTKTLVLVVGLAMLAGCNKKEGAPEKKYRIDEVLAVEKQYENDVLIHAIDTYVEEDWHWEGKEVYRIDYRSDHPYSENIFYDKHRRIASTTIPAYSIMTEFAYEGNLLDHIDCFRDGKLMAVYTFVHDEDQLTEIDCQRYQLEDTLAALPMCGNPLGRLLGREMTGKLLEATAAKRHQDAKGGALTRYLLTWTEGNVTSIECQEGGEKYDITLTYDGGRNPYNQLFAYRELSDPLYGFEMLSQNNIVTLQLPTSNGKTQLYSYQYEYDDDIPSKRTLSYSYLMMSDETFDSVVYRFQKTETFHYLD